MGKNDAAVVTRDGLIALVEAICPERAHATSVVVDGIAYAAARRTTTGRPTTTLTIRVREAGERAPVTYHLQARAADVCLARESSEVRTAEHREQARALFPAARAPALARFARAANVPLRAL